MILIVLKHCKVDILARMPHLTLCSYNCCSLKNNIDIIRDLTEQNIDLIFLQETFITSNHLDILDFVDERYGSIGVGAIYSDRCLESGGGRPMGGLACLYKINSGFTLELIESNNDIMILRLIIDNIQIILINIYIRSDLGNPDTLAAYLESLNNVESMLEDIDYDSVYLIGDFNADPMRGRAWSNLGNFSNRNDFTIFDVLDLPSNSFTYISNGFGHCKWLDHVIGRSNTNIVSLSNMKILYDKIGSDHLPIMFNINIPKIPAIHKTNKEENAYVDWARLNEDDMIHICKTAYLIQGNYHDNIQLICDDLNCNNTECLDKINTLYIDIIESIRVASLSFCKNIYRKNKYKIIPGWNRREFG